jgi:cytochrome c-type biogenesis protein CcmF
VSAGLTGFAMLALNNRRFGITMPLEEHMWIDFPFGFKAALLPWMATLLFVCMFVAVSSVWRIIELAPRAKLSLGGFVSHFGVAMLMAGLILSRGFETKERGFLRQEHPETIMGYTLALREFTDDRLEDRDNKVIFDVTGPNGETFEARPGMYYYVDGEGKQQPMVWPHIRRHLKYDWYMTLHPPQIYVWQEPVWFKPGESHTLNGITVTYVEPTRNGDPGQPGTSFGAKTLIEIEGEKYEVEPQLVLMQDGPPNPTIPKINNDFRIAIMRMDAADQTVAMQVMFASPIWPIELFYKPMTWLVWLGTGILTLGGFWAAAARRRPRFPGPTAGAEALSEPKPESEEKENAPLATA